MSVRLWPRAPREEAQEGVLGSHPRCEMVVGEGLLGSDVGAEAEAGSRCGRTARGWEGVRRAVMQSLRGLVLRLVRWFQVVTGEGFLDVDVGAEAGGRVARSRLRRTPLRVVRRPPGLRRIWHAPVLERDSLGTWPALSFTL